MTIDTSTSPTFYFLMVKTNDLMNVLKILGPKRITKAIRALSLDIAYLDGEAVFTSPACQTPCKVLQANWPGYATVSLAALLAFRTAPPTTDVVNIQIQDGRLRIGTMVAPAKWAGAAPWITDMAATARFHEDPNPTSKEIRNCEFRFRCPKTWDVLTHTDNYRVRHCKTCDRPVVYCRTPYELRDAIIKNECVAVEVIKGKGRQRSTHLIVGDPAP
jgi:hypothetical protein